MKDNLAQRNVRSIAFAARLLSAALIIAGLYYGRFVLMPLALALLIAFALHPVVRKLVSWHVPRVLSVIIVVMLLIAVLGGVGGFIGGQLAQFAEDLPSYRENITDKVRDARRWMSGGVMDNLKDTATMVSEEAGVDASEGADTPVKVENVGNDALGFRWLESIGLVTDPLTTFGLVILLVAMLLLKWSDLRARLLSLLPERLAHTTGTLTDASQRVGHFLFLQLIYNTSFGIVIGLVLWAIGVPYAALWGLCAALFRYVPYVGPVLAALLPMAVSLVTSSGWGQIGAVAAVFVVLELISNNLVEPWLYGSKLGVTEIGIIMSCVAWTYLWGPIGLLLATPLTVILVVMGKHVPSMAIFAKLMGRDEVVTVPDLYYQRLLAGDSLEAAERTEKLIQESGCSAFIKGTLLPALAHARRDHAAGWLTAENSEVLVDELRAVTQTVLDAEGMEEPPAPIPQQPFVLWSACPLTDEILPLLKHEVARGAAVTVKSADLIGGAIKQLTSDGRKPRAVTVLHLSEVDTPRALAVLKRLRLGMPDVPVQVSRLGEGTFTESQCTALAPASSRAGSIDETRAWAAAFIASTAA